MRDAHGLMNLRMVMDEIIDRVAPGASPSIAVKDSVDDSGRLETLRADIDRPAIEDHRETGIVWNDPVIVEEHCDGLARMDQRGQSFLVRPALDSLAGVVLDLILQRHQKLPEGSTNVGVKRLRSARHGRIEKLPYALMHFACDVVPYQPPALISSQGPDPRCTAGSHLLL